MQGDGDEEEDTKLGRGTHQSHQETLKQRDWAGSGPWCWLQAGTGLSLLSALYPLVQILTPLSTSTPLPHHPLTTSTSFPLPWGPGEVPPTK